MKTAMILAAGRGERLRPITDKCPKALCRVHNIPLIEYHVIRLAQAGYEKLIINHAYLGGQIRDYLGNGSRWDIAIHYSPEPPGGLETGGGIINALPLIGTHPFTTINADILTDYDFGSLALPKNGLAHIVLVTKPAYYSHGDFGLGASQNLDNLNRVYTFSGIACYHPNFFQNITLSRTSVTPLLRSFAKGNQATGELYQGKWLDIGSPERLRMANKMINT